MHSAKGSVVVVRLRPGLSASILNCHNKISSSQFISFNPNPTAPQVRHRRRYSDFAHHAEPGSFATTLSSVTYPQGSHLINSRHFYQNTVVLDWVKRQPRPVSLRQLAFFGRKLTSQKLISSCNFVQEELPTRIAHRIREMQVLPFAVVSNPHLCKVYEMYYTAFDRFRKFPKVKTLEDNDRFCALLNELLNDHLSIIPDLVIGAIECSLYQSIDSGKLDSFMSSVLCSRISRRVIAEQHLSLTANFKKGTYNMDHDPNYIGAVFLRCNAKEIVEQCGQTATELIQGLYPNAKMPEIIIEGLTETTFLYMKSHLSYIIGEILRNSIEATVRKHYHTKKEDDNDFASSPPPIVVSISNTAQNILIRVSDQGGGIPADILPHIWSFSKGPRSQGRLDNFKQVRTFAGITEEVAKSASSPTGTSHNNLNNGDSNDGHQIPNVISEGKELAQFFQHSTSCFISESGSSLDGFVSSSNNNSATTTNTEGSIENSDSSSLTSLSSRPPYLKLGMGLPLSRVYADYWDGHIDLHSLEGYGVDVFLRISRLGNQNEKLQLDRV